MTTNLKRKQLENWLMVSIVLNFGSFLISQNHPIIGGLVGMAGVVVFCVTVVKLKGLTRHGENARETNRSR